MSTPLIARRRALSIVRLRTVNNLTRHAYAGIHDLRRMQAAVAAAHQHTWWRIGDLAWMARNLTHLEMGTWVTLWEHAPGEAGTSRDPVAWIWASAKGWVDYFAAPTVHDVQLLSEMVDAAEAMLAAADSAGDTVEAVTLVVAETDTAMLDLLRRRGYAPAPEGFDVNRRTLDGLGDATLPPGYSLCGVDDSRVEGRVEAQRAAFAPSTLTLERYRRVRRIAPYRPELDRVVVDRAGEVVAFCTAWLDEANSDGLLEPVGTRPTHQRRGLATAVCLDALRALRGAGARTAQVSCEWGSPGCATYRAVGFTVAERAVAMRRALS